MPTNERDEEHIAEQVEALEREQADLKEAYDRGDVSKPEFARHNSRIAFQVDQLLRQSNQALDHDREPTH